MLLFIVMVIAVLITGFCIGLTSKQKRKRIISGVTLVIISILSYPLFISIVLDNWKGDSLEGVANVFAFDFILLLGGIVTLIIGFFTKPPISHVKPPSDN